VDLNIGIQCKVLIHSKYISMYYAFVLAPQLV